MANRIDRAVATPRKSKVRMSRRSLRAHTTPIILLLPYDVIHM
jgi:hypothetical protein